MLGDSAESSVTMENHAGRPEVMEAIKKGSGSAIRYSTTVRYDMLYRAFHQTGAGHGSHRSRRRSAEEMSKPLISSFRRSLFCRPASGFGGGLAPCLQFYLAI